MAIQNVIPVGAVDETTVSTITTFTLTTPEAAIDTKGRNVQVTAVTVRSTEHEEIVTFLGHRVRQSDGASLDKEDRALDISVDNYSIEAWRRRGEQAVIALSTSLEAVTETLAVAPTPAPEEASDADQ